MKKTISLGTILIAGTLFSQLYIPNGAMQPSSNGNIGIGISNPTNTLDVMGSISVQRGSPILIGGNTDIFHGLKYQVNFYNSNLVLDGPFLYGWGGGSLGVKRADKEINIINWNEFGNVGIGTLSPISRLDINGSVNFGKQIAPPRTSGTINRVTIQPYGHTGGPWNIAARDDYDNAFLDYSYGGGDNIISLSSLGNVGIGQHNPIYKLDVRGTIHAKEVKVDMNGWSDFVFKKDYNLRSLEEVARHIKENGTLPDIPSEKEVLEKGVNLGEINKKLLQKIEELTLYQIQMNKELKQLKEENKKLRNQLKLYDS